MSEVQRNAKGQLEVIRTGRPFTEISGMECIERHSDPKQEVWKKTFNTKPLYETDRLEEFLETYTKKPNYIPIVVNGYTDLSEARRKAWGLEPGEYEAACKEILSSIIARKKARCPEANFCLVHGASNINGSGIDAVSMEVAWALDIQQIGVTCADWLIYAPDDSTPVYIAADKEDFSKRLIQFGKLLITMNGAKTTFEQDIRAAIEDHKKVILVDVVSAIARNGDPRLFNDQGDVEDAIAAWLKLVESVNLKSSDLGSDPINRIKRRLFKKFDRATRMLLEPSVAYRVYKPADFVR